jgi:hypothetical protein
MALREDASKTTVGGSPGKLSNMKLNRSIDGSDKEQIFNSMLDSTNKNNRFGGLGSHMSTSN